MKKAALCLLALSLLFSAAAVAEPPRIGLMVYNGTDRFMSDVCAHILEMADGVAEIVFLDSQNVQTLQNEQVEGLLKDGVDALIINAVDRTAAVFLIEKIARKNIPVVFINREPLVEDILRYGKAYYVGNAPKESGLMCGELLAEYLARYPAADRNGDGVIQYVMLKGEPGHQDAELRTQYAIKALQRAGFRVERLAEDTAMWERATANDIMSGFLLTYGDRIECVIANNDEMALGAIDALKAAGYADALIPPVVGVDATEPALAAIREGSLLGTVLNDAFSLADAALRLAVLLAEGTEVDADVFPYAVDENRYVWTESRKITRESLSGERGTGW